MPELPEVESVRLVLDSQVVGRTVIRVQVRTRSMVSLPGLKSLLCFIVRGILDGLNALVSLASRFGVFTFLVPAGLKVL